VLVGHGLVGERLARLLRAEGLAVVVAELQRERVEALRDQGLPAVCGDASEPAVLIQAHIARAAMLVVTAGDSLQARRMCDTARQLNPGIRLLLCARSEDEAQLLRDEGLGEVLQPEQALAESLGQRALAQLGKH